MNNAMKCPKDYSKVSSIDGCVREKGGEKVECVEESLFFFSFLLLLLRIINQLRWRRRRRNPFFYSVDSLLHPFFWARSYYYAHIHITWAMGIPKVVPIQLHMKMQAKLATISKSHYEKLLDVHNIYIVHALSSRNSTSKHEITTKTTMPKMIEQTCQPVLTILNILPLRVVVKSGS